MHTMKTAKRLFLPLLALVLAASCILPVAAVSKESAVAAAIRLTKAEGTVNIKNGDGKKVSRIDKMRLYSGYSLETAESSYAWINLDDVKLIKEDASSKVQVRKSGKNLEVKLEAGALFFNVTEPLKADESLNISTSTMIVGIRGTSGWVRIAADGREASISLGEGTAQLSVTDPVSGQTKNGVIRGGQEATCVVYPQERAGDKCDILMDGYKVEDIPGFVLYEMVRDVELCDKILEETGTDILRELAKTAGGDPSGRASANTATPELLGLVQKKQRQEESERQESSRADAESSSEPSDETSSESSSSSDPSAPVAVTMPRTAAQLQMLLNGRSRVTVRPSGDAAQDTLTVDSSLRVPSGKTLEAASGVPVSVPSSGTLTVDGTMDVAGNMSYSGTVAVNSSNTLRVAGDLISSGGTLAVSQTGRVVVEGTVQGGTTLQFSQGGRLLAKAFSDAFIGSLPSGLRVSAGADASGYYTLEIDTVRPVYTVTFDGNGAVFDEQGTTTTAAQTPAGGGTVSFPSAGDMMIMGQSFIGWYTAAEGGTLVESTQEFYKDTTLYAHWSYPLYVMFDANGGQIDGEGGATYTVIYGTLLSALPPPEPTLEGYSFAGWYTAAEGGTELDPSHKVTDGLLFYAHWTPLTYTVTFDANGGEVDGIPVSNYTVNYGTLLSALPPPEPTLEGYSFAGWYTAAEGGTELDPSHKVTDGLLFYAHWTPLTYTVTFDANGGEVDGIPVSNYTVNYGTILSTLPPPEPSWEGHTFIGWYTAKGGSGTALDINQAVTEGLKFYAHWTGVYTVTLDCNGGHYLYGGNEVGQIERTVESGTRFGAVEPESPYREGYGWDGWFTKPDETGVKVKNDQEVTADMTVYAHWTVIYTVTFDVNGGTFSDSAFEGKDIITVQVADGQTIPADQIPSDPKWTNSTVSFNGWMDTETKSYFDPATDKVTKNISLKAQWYDGVNSDFINPTN